MDTNQLIAKLSGDPRPRTASFAMVWGGALVLAIALAGAVFFAALGPRPDIAAAAETPRFLFKFVVVLLLAASALWLVTAMSRPGEDWRTRLAGLALAPALLAVAGAAELFLVPPESWPVRAIGTNNLVCLFYVPLIGIGPLAVFLVALRHGAPTRPAFAGAVAGLLAGGVAASFYAAHCTDDSPLFVAIWYSIAILGLALVGALVARRVARW